MATTEPPRVCGAVYFGFEVVRCQLPAGHTGLHAYRRSDEVGSQRWATPRASYQAQVRKRAVLKAPDAARQASEADATDNSA